ncbi:MAG: immunoglobulin-like domain-containing protein, partial [Paraclostridium sp.]
MKNKKAVSVLTASMVIASNISTVVPVMALEQNTSNNMVESNEDVNSNEIVEINEEIESNEIEEDISKGVNLEENQEHEEIEVEDIQIKGAIEKEDNNIVEIPKEKEQKKEYIEPRLSMGEPKIDKSTIIFPNIDVAFEDTKDLVIDYIPTENVEPNSVTYTYKRGSTKEVVEGFNLDIKDLTLQEAQEVLSTLEINSNVSGTIKSRLNDIVISISDRPNSSVKPTILVDNNKNSGWYSATHQSNKTEVITIDFKGSRFLNSVGINSMVNNSNTTRTLLIEGKKEGSSDFKQIGRVSKSITNKTYTDLIASVEEGYYTQIRLKHTTGYTPVMKEILFNGEQSTWLNSTVGSVDVVIEPIAEDTEAPILEGVKDIEIVEGTEINLLEGISANDNSDGDITDTVKVEVLKNNEVVTDYTGVGEYTLRYRVTDASGNETVLESKLIVKEDVDKVEINSIDISKGLENAIVTSSRGYILGFKVEATSESDVTFKYTLSNGESVENTTNVLNFYDKYTTEEVENILKSMTVESDSNVKLKVTIGNIHPNIGYLESEGHYYELKSTDNNSKIGWNKANELAKTYTFLG